MSKLKKAVQCLVLFVCIAACHVTQKSEKLSLPAFDTEGHRGCRGLMPENTIPAFMKALELGVSTLEMDAVITKDNQVICSHEPFFNHEITTKPNGEAVTEQEEKSLNIYKMTLSETQQYDVGIKPHPRFPNQQKIKATKPLLREVIENAEAFTKLKGRKDVFYNIETKSDPAGDNLYHPEPEEFVNQLMKVINSKGVTNRVIIQSFDFRTLKVIHKRYPNVKTAALVEDFDKKTFEDHLQQLGFVPTIYAPAYQHVTKELVNKCHRRNVKIIPWTVNDRATIESLKKMGVDGIISDYPDLF